MTRRILQSLEKILRIFPIVGTFLLAAGCATVPYTPGVGPARPDTLALRPGEPQVERGERYWLLDGIGWVLGIPSKIILWNIRVDNHRISTNTEEALVRYFEANEMGATKVRLNQYDPVGEWSRLFRNKRVGWGWRYTFGLVGNVFYTLLPCRLIGGDHYNPYTDTINLYSDVPAIALHEGGHAKDFARRSYPGSYAALSLIPFSSLYFEKVATGDAIGYLREHGTAAEEKAAYKILYPAYGTYVGGGFGEVAVPMAPALYVGGVVVGHVSGRLKATGVDARRAAQAPPAVETLEPSGE